MNVCVQRKRNGKRERQRAKNKRKSVEKKTALLMLEAQTSRSGYFVIRIYTHVLSGFSKVHLHNTR